MARKNIKQTEIAEKVFDTYPQWVQARVKGHVPMTAAELLAIADYLDTDITEFAWAAKGGRPTPGGAQATPQWLPPKLHSILGEGQQTPAELRERGPLSVARQSA